MEQAKNRTKRKALALLRCFYPYFRPYWSVLLLDLCCAGLTTACELVLPYIVRDITNAGVSDIASLTVARIASVAGLYIFLRLIDAGANYYMASGGHVMGAKIETDMRNALFAHLQELSYSFYDNSKVGQLMSRITTDLFDITEFAHHFPEEMFIALIKIMGGFFIFASMNFYLALVIFSVLPLMLVVTHRSRKNMQNAFRQGRHQIGEINAQTEDSLLGIRVVQSFANEHIEKAKFDKGARRWLKIRRKSYRYMASFHTTIRMFDGLMYLVVIVAGALFIRAGKMTVGDFSASLMMATVLLGSIRRVVEFSEQFSHGITGIERFQEIMEELVEIRDSENAVTITETKGEIRFEDVGFSYAGTDSHVLRNLNLTIQPGENVAIVGPSGGGKTTLCNLIPRFYDVVEGTIFLDGRDIREISLASLRAHIGVVQQDVYLFSGTVYENIAYGRPEAGRKEVEDAARKAGAYEFISALPEGFDTFVGERGVKLSGGQKQRVSIARLFLKDPAILILDEATSALDNESERLVQKSLEHLAVGRTTVTIAHRLTTIRNASKIIVLTEDGIAEQGSHTELLEKQGIYSDLYALYTDKV